MSYRGSDSDSSDMDVEEKECKHDTESNDEWDESSEDEGENMADPDSKYTRYGEWDWEEEHGSLMYDIEQALDVPCKGQGSFCFVACNPDTPNPCLVIEGVGGIGLPLSERDIKTVISCLGRPSPDLLQNTWLIEPSKLSFRNPRWESWLKKLLKEDIWEEFGFESKPKVELKGLVILGEGSDLSNLSLLNSDDASVASLMIVLPSPHEGGSIDVSQSTASISIDISPLHCLRTAVLAWRNDATQTFKPITSGHRFALLYTLNSAKPNQPRPEVFNVEIKTALGYRTVLQKWAAKDYASEMLPAIPFVGYILKHQYPEYALDAGLASLRGVDSVRIAHLVPIAQEFGFCLGLANMEYWEHGGATDYDCPDDDLEIEECLSRGYELLHRVDSQGKPVGNSSRLPVHPSCIVPREFYSNTKFDEKEVDPGLLLKYKRTVLLMYRRRDTPKVMISLYGRGFRWGIRCLQQTTDSSSKRKQKILHELRRLIGIASTSLGRKYEPVWVDPFSGFSSSTLDSARCDILDIAVTWKDSRLWTSVAGELEYKLETIQVERLIGALRAFNLGSLQPCLDNIFNLAKPSVLHVVFNLVSKAFPEDLAIGVWLSSHQERIVTTYTAGSLNDVPMLLSLAKKSPGGLTKLSNCVIPNVSSTTSGYEFWTSLGNALYDAREELSAFETPEVSVISLVEKCLKAAAVRTVEAVGTVAVIRLCFRSGFMALCNLVLAETLKNNSPDVRTRFTACFIPLIHQLKPLLAEFGHDFSSSPFNAVIQGLTRHFVSNCLGTKDRHIPSPRIRSVGCAQCVDCENLDVFFNSPRLRCEITGMKPRKHVEQQLQSNSGWKFSTWRTVKDHSPHVLVVEKTAEVQTEESWLGRVERMKSFLEVIGTMDEVEKILGTNEYEGLMNLMERGEIVMENQGRMNSPPGSSKQTGRKRKNDDGDNETGRRVLVKPVRVTNSDMLD